MKVHAAALSACISWLLAAGLASPATARSRPCRPPVRLHHIRLLAHDRKVRVQAGLPRGSTDRVTYACLVSDGAPYTLGGTNNDSASLIRLRGAVVGYAHTSYGLAEGHDTAVLLDLRAHRRLADAPGVGSGAGSCTASAQSSALGLVDQITDLVVSSRKTVAWIGQQEPSHCAEVHELPAGGADQLLDAGTAIEPHSLRLAAGILTWRDAGQVRQVRLARSRKTK